LFQALPFLADGQPEIGGDALGDIELEVDLLRTVGSGRVIGDLWQRHFVGDKRIVGQDRRREEPFARETVSKSVINRGNH